MVLLDSTYCGAGKVGDVMLAVVIVLGLTFFVVMKQLIETHFFMKRMRQKAAMLKEKYK